MAVDGHRSSRFLGSWCSLRMAASWRRTPWALASLRTRPSTPGAAGSRRRLPRPPMARVKTAAAAVGVVRKGRGVEWVGDWAREKRRRNKRKRKRKGHGCSPSADGRGFFHRFARRVLCASWRQPLQAGGILYGRSRRRRPLNDPSRLSEGRRDWARGRKSIGGQEPTRLKCAVGRSASSSVWGHGGIASASVPEAGHDVVS